ncbi:hypothetical protein IW140_002715 [Coemansia sp. RSA 1813]|nr:hypothetical protein IW138_002695 [Coemansia sp. RSA 986]KAJ2215449.1 hypothetical protein EV179_002234 [Coemansia sp. RSA 487]KAJ2570037.1 hypothetical protein IW140_002715 [Coemansia sp. RSA 1813]
MNSDEEDAQPKTLAERIARLGLDNEAARPSSRTSIYGVSTRSIEPAQPTSAAHGKPPPPIAPKPQFSARPQKESAGAAYVQRPAAMPTPVSKHSNSDISTVLAQQSARSPSPRTAGRNEGLGISPKPKAMSEPPAEDEPVAISIKDRIRNLNQAQINPSAGRFAEPTTTTTTTTTTMTTMTQNPFASPELQNEDRRAVRDDALDARPLSPLAPLPPPAHVVGGPISDVSRGSSLPPPPPPPALQSRFSLNVQTPLNLHSASPSREASPANSTKHAGRGSPMPPPPPPPPQPSTHPRPTSMMPLQASYTGLERKASVSNRSNTLPRPPPKPAAVGAVRSPTFASSTHEFPGSIAGLVSPTKEHGYVGVRGASLPPPPPPPPSALSQQRSSPAKLLDRSSLPPPPPPPPQAPLLPQTPGRQHTLHDQILSPILPVGEQHPQQQAILSRQSTSVRSGSISVSSSTNIASHSARTALDFSSDLSLRPTQPSYRLSNRRPPALGVQPFLSSEASGVPVLSCLGGMYSVVVQQSRVMCTKVDSGEMCAIHNAPGPEERFTHIAPVHAMGDPSAECSRVWTFTSSGRVVVLNTFNTGTSQETLQTSSRAPVINMFSSVNGEIWTLRDDGMVEVWRDRSIDGGHDQPLVPVRKFSISNELQMARRMASQRFTLLLYQRELWFASTRCIWVYDTHRSAEPLASMSGSTLLSTPSGQAQSLGLPLKVAQINLTSHDSTITCIASNVEYMDESRIDSRGFVFCGTDAGHVVVWKASTYERWRTLDMSSGEADVRITAMACVSDRWLWIGYASGKISVVDIGADMLHPAAAVSCPLKLGYHDSSYASIQRRDSMWIVAKEWVAAESAVANIHVDWSPLLTERCKLQIATVHANGSVFYWDGTLAMDCQYNEMRRRTHEFAQMRDITVQINSWNIDAIKPEHLEKSRDDKEFLREWLGASSNPHGPEIIVVGLQEVVDLESKKMTAKSLWKNTTSKHKGKSGAKPSADISKRYGLWRAALEKKLTRELTYTTPYRIVECQNMVGLFICIFARDDVYRSVQNVDVSQVKTGMGGLHGNKGGIGIRFILNDTSFCFVNAHLAAGESVRNNVARVEHCTTIVKGTTFKRPKTECQAVTLDGSIADRLVSAAGASNARLPVSPISDLANVTLDAYVDGGDGQRYLDHAVCFFSGDLNFRLNLSRQQTERYVEANELDALLQYDQLLPLIASDSHPKAPLSSNSSYSNFSADPTLSLTSSRLSRITSHGQLQPPAPKDHLPAKQRNQASSSHSSSPYSSGDEGDDEAKDVQASGFALRAFHEMPIQFHPTYKYDPGTDRYDTSEKRRTPAWCDRVLFRGGSGRLQIKAPPQAPDSHPAQPQQTPDKLVDYDMQGQITPLLYRRLECKQSDHRPIVSAFQVKTKSIDRDMRKQVLEGICQQLESQGIPETVYYAKMLWLSRHTANMARASELLASTQGNLHDAIQSHYQNGSQ